MIAILRAAWRGSNATPRVRATSRHWSIADLKAAIHAYLEQHNAEPKPFVWTAKAANILEKVVRGRKALEPVH